MSLLNGLRRSASAGPGGWVKIRWTADVHRRLEVTFPSDVERRVWGNLREQVGPQAVDQSLEDVKLVVAIFWEDKRTCRRFPRARPADR